MVVLFFEAIALLFSGVILGIVTAMADVYLVGSASFLTHMLIWVLLNVILATHIESVGRAMWWSVPINLGFIESYYICTSAGFEGYPRALVATFALLAVLAPFLVFGLWWVKKSKNIYGWLLAAGTAGGSVYAHYLVNGEVSNFSIVVGVITFSLLTFIPTRKLKITPSERPEPTEEEQAEIAKIVQEEQRQAERKQKRRNKSSRHETPAPEPEEGRRPQQLMLDSLPMIEDVPEEEARPTARPSRPTRRKNERKRRSNTSQGRRRRETRESERSARRIAAVERKEQALPEPEPEPNVALPTLGTTRAVTRRYESY